VAEAQGVRGFGLNAEGAKVTQSTLREDFEREDPKIAKSGHQDTRAFDFLKPAKIMF